jgi:hypothetical protein
VIWFVCAGAGLAGGPGCELYPIGLSADTLRSSTSGEVVDEVWEGNAPGQFRWLSWSGSPSEQLLARSLWPPGNSESYVNPDDPRDTMLSVGDWVVAKPGVSNSREVRSGSGRSPAALGCGAR